MTIKFEKKDYVAPAMTIVEMSGEDAPILCSSCVGDCYEGDDDGDALFGAIDIFGNDKA